MTQFTFPTNLADHLQQEIYTKLVAEVQSNVDKLNAMWAKREQEGKTFHTKQTWHGEEKVYWYKFSEFITITFHQEEDSWNKKMRNDYYRPLSCVLNTEACLENAIAQRKHSVALCT